MIDTWYLIPKGEESQRTQISEDEARKILRQWKNNVNAELIGRKPDGTEYLKEVLNLNDWRIQKGEPQSKEDTKEKRWICNYGTRHKMSDGVFEDPNTGKKSWSASHCGCVERFNVPSFLVLKWLQKFWKIEHVHQITPTMQKDFLDKNQI
jgi:hypothetical protein